MSNLQKSKGFDLINEFNELLISWLFKVNGDWF